MSKTRLNQLLGATLIVWGLLLLVLINGCTDDCAEGDAKCDDLGQRVLTCVDGDWVVFDDCADAVNFNLELDPMVCCDGECRESCE